MTVGCALIPSVPQPAAEKRERNGAPNFEEGSRC